jgi:hypothetical protein
MESEVGILPMMILMAFVVLLLIPVLEAEGTSIQSVSFFCPFANQDVTADLVERRAFELGTAVDVHACCAFDEPQQLRCDKKCLELPAIADSHARARVGMRTEVEQAVLYLLIVDCHPPSTISARPASL